MSKKRRHKADIEEAFHVFDLDGSGTIDFDEFLQMMTAKMVPNCATAPDLRDACADPRLTRARLVAE